MSNYMSVNSVESTMAQESILAHPSSGFLGTATSNTGVLELLAPPHITIPQSVEAMEARISGSIAEPCRANDTGNVVTPRGSSTSSSVNSLGEKEKIGRWTELEHQVFLQGLEKHGKQWKMIANMIGTRTVVQVRTHAQKYFQRVERHGSSGSRAAPSATHKPSPKRKMSLPPSSPSRSPKEPKISKKVARALSLPALPSQKPTEQIPQFPNFVSNPSSVSTESECVWNTFSPTSVIDTCELDSFCFPSTSEGADFKSEHNTYDFKELGDQDPLEWLVDVEPSILPESSLPMFPDLTAQEIDACDHFSEGNFVSEDGISESSDSSLIHESALNNMIDPSVTVKSLLLLPEGIEGF